jgi:membrane protein implicated in regulation of membrane protease activity
MMDVSPFLFYIILGVALITFELLVFGMSVFWFLFIGLGALVAAVVAWQLPEISWLMATGTFVIASAIISGALYVPLKRWQQKPSVMSGKSDAIGQSVEALTEITTEKSGSVSWSGAKWEAKLATGSEPLQEGDNAEITKLGGIVLWVKKV